MNRATLIRYTPLYVSLTITAIVLTVLFLLPGAALGLVVEVDTPENDRNSLSGFALGEAIPINARVNLEGEFETLISELEIEQISGGPGFINVTGTGAVSLPLEPVTGDDLSDQLSQGTLSADVAFILVTINPIGYPLDGSGYGYGYFQGEEGGGQISYFLTYTPPAITGDYVATITLELDDGTAFSTATEFSILGPLEGTTIALTTLYPASEDGAALDGDVAILRVDVAGTLNNIASVELDGDLIPGAEMISSTLFHDSLKTKWGASSGADFLYPFRVAKGTPSGTLSPTATIEDRAGQTDSVTFTVEVTGSRETFNLYLMPELNFITPGLQCAFPPATAIVCTGGAGDVSFDIAELLGQPVTNVDPDFLTAIGETEATVTVADVVDLIFAYDPTLVTPDFTIFSSDGDPANDTLTTMTAGLAYILTIAEAGPLDPFIRNPDPDIDQLTHDGVPLDVPVPLKLTFTGLVDADPGTVSPSTDVVVGWNLVGPHSQADTDVATFLAAVTFPLRTWASLIAAKNILDLAYDDDGNAVLSADGTPVHDFTESLAFESLSGPPLLDNDPVPAGSGLWLFMGEDGELPPVGVQR